MLTTSKALLQTLATIFCLSILTLILASCNESAPIIATLIPVTRLEFIRQGTEYRPSGDPISFEVNWCGGTGPYYKYFGGEITRTVTVTLKGEAEIEAQVGSENIAAMKARVAAEYGRAVGQVITWSNSDQPTVAEGTHVTFQIQVQDMWEVGQVNVLDFNQSGSYEILTGFKTDVINSQKIECTDLDITPPTGVATIPATSQPLTASLFEDFATDAWYNNPQRWRNFTGRCNYAMQNGIGIISSTNSDSCAFALVDPLTGSELVPLSNVGHVSADVGLVSGNGYMGQGIGLYSDSGWWTICTLRQENSQANAVFEVQSPAGYNNYVLLPINQKSAQLRLEVTNGELICTINGQQIGRIAIQQLPLSADSIVTRTFNSDRPDGNAITSVDNVSMSN